jgi:hypothetical protein
MKQRSSFTLAALVLGCATLAMTTFPVEARDIRAHAGTTFELWPVEFDANGNPTKFTHTIDGVVRVSLLGNCTFHGDVLGFPRPDGSLELTGTGRITTANGATILDFEVKGVVATDPANPAFGNFHYDAWFTGGTGQMANAHGKANIDGFGMFTSPSTGKATWTMLGEVSTRGHQRRPLKSSDLPR